MSGLDSIQNNVGPVLMINDGGDLDNGSPAYEQQRAVIDSLTVVFPK